MNSQDLLNCAQQIYSDEGFKPLVYKDTEKNDTIGIGFLLKYGFTLEECMAVLKIKLGHLAEALSNHFCKQWNSFSVNRQSALLNMAYQIGVEGIMEFKGMWLAIGVNDWTKASQEALDSSYGRKFPARAERNAKLLLSG